MIVALKEGNESLNRGVDQLTTTVDRFKQFICGLKAMNVHLEQMTTSDNVDLLKLIGNEDEIRLLDMDEWLGSFASARSKQTPIPSESESEEIQPVWTIENQLEQLLNQTKSLKQFSARLVEVCFHFSFVSVKKRKID